MTIVPSICDLFCGETGYCCFYGCCFVFGMAPRNLIEMTIAKGIAATVEIAISNGISVMMIGLPVTDVWSGCIACQLESETPNGGCIVSKY